MDLSLQHICCQLGGKDVLNDISLTVGSGEFVSLLGASGAGKTTTLKIIAGIQEQSSGHVLLGGEVIDHLHAHRRHVAIVFQDVRLFPNMDVGDNVAFPLRMQGVGRAQRRERAARMLEAVQLEGFSDRRCHELSGGQQQRVALARALAGKPDVLLLDEPFSGLDEELREDMRALVLRLHEELGTTSIQVTHDATEALMMSDRIMYMTDGRIVQTATPVELYRHPATLEVATCTGSCSTVSGTIAHGVFGAGGLAIPLAAAGTASALGDGDTAVAVLRHEALSACAGDTFLVESCQYRGGAYVAYVLLADGQKLALGTDAPIEPGARIGVQTKPEAVFVYPAPSSASSRQSFGKTGA